jgi:hypothetical protein
MTRNFLIEMKNQLNLAIPDLFKNKMNDIIWKNIWDNKVNKIHRNANWTKASMGSE